MKKTLAALGTALLMVALVSSTALAATSKVTSVGTWKLSSGPDYAVTKATTSTGATGFDFGSTAASYADLLTTTQDKSLLGDLTEKTIKATFTVTASSNAVFTYAGDPDGSGAGSTARLYFKSNLGGAFANTNYWWSNPIHFTFVNGTASTTVTLTVPLEIGNWSDWNGQADSTVATEFAQAVTNVGQIGLSFGGGYFFANGVGVSAGTASFLLTDFTAN